MGGQQISGLTVVIDADLSKLTSGISQAKGQLSSLTAAAHSSSTNLLSGFKNAASGLLDMGAKVGMAVVGIKGIADAALGLGTALLQPAMNAEQMKIAFTSLLHSGTAATKMMATLNDLAVKTPFELPQIQAGAKQLLAFKFAGADVPMMLTRIGDAVSSVGGGAEGMQRVIVALGQMKLKGKATGEEMLQLTELNIDAWGYVAKALGISTAKAQEMSSKGLIPADVAIKAILDGMKEFGGAMDKQSASALGLASTLKDAFNVKVLTSFGEGLLTPLKGAMTDLINMFNAPVFQQFATQLGTQVGAAIVNVVNAFKQMIVIGQQIIAFFQQNQAALQALQTALLIAAGIAVAAFGAWAIAAGAAAIATLAAAWPILAIGAAIGLLAAGFMALYNSSAPFRAFIGWLGAALQAVWSFIVSSFTPMWTQLQAVMAVIGAFLVSTFAPVWAQLVNVWQTQMLPALTQLWAALQPLAPLFQVLGAIILGIVVVALVVLVSILVGVVQGLANLLSGLAIALGGIVQMVSGFITIIAGIITLIIDLVTGNFSKLGADLGVIWQGIVTMFTGIWNVIRGVFSGAIGFIVGLVGGFVSTIIALFTGLAHTLVGGSIVPDMCNAILNWFRQLGPNIVSIVQSMVSSAIAAFNNFRTQAVAAAMGVVNGIKNAFNGLASAASSWIADMGSNIVSGLNALVGQVSAAAKNVASAIAKNLAHSVPKEGPLHTELQWMPHLGDNLASGLRAQVGKVKLASLDVASSIAQPYAPSLSSLSSPSSGEYAVAASTSGGNGDLTIIMSMDGYEMARQVMPHVDGIKRLKMGIRGR